MPPTGPYAKPYLDVHGQIAQLKARGMTITDDAKAHAYLSRLGYYRLSGYWYPFRRSTQTADPADKPIIAVHDDFKPGSEFRHVIELYVFDKRLRLLALDAIERIEVCLRVEIALLLGKRDPLGHRNARELDVRFTSAAHGESGHQKWLRRLNDAESRSKEEFVKSFRSKYDGDLPIWMTIELWDFGLLSVFYAGMRHSDREAIAARYGVNQHLMKSWLRSINHLRNICAHHARLWNRAIADQPAMPKHGTIHELDHIAGHPNATFRIYAIVAIIRYLLKRINPTSTWAQRMSEQVAAFPAIPGLSVEQSGFPPNWRIEALWH